MQWQTDWSVCFTSPVPFWDEHLDVVVDASQVGLTTLGSDSFLVTWCCGVHYSNKFGKSCLRVRSSPCISARSELRLGTCAAFIRISRGSEVHSGGSDYDDVKNLLSYIQSSS